MKKGNFNQWITNFKNMDKKEFIRKNDKLIAISMITFSGMLCLSVGVALPLLPKEGSDKTVLLQISKSQVEKKKSNEIVLKEMQSEVNQPISVDVRDYVDTTLLDEEVIKKLKLDTSLVNILEPGNYTYVIKYKNKTYNGIYVIKEKELPKVDKITLKSFDWFVGQSLSQNLDDYITVNLSDEVKANCKLDLSQVNINQVGAYAYTVSYDGQVYTGVINVINNPAEQPTQQEVLPPASTDNTGVLPTT